VNKVFEDSFVIVSLIDLSIKNPFSSTPNLINLIREWLDKSDPYSVMSHQETVKRDNVLGFY